MNHHGILKAGHCILKILTEVFKQILTNDEQKKLFRVKFLELRKFALPLDPDVFESSAVAISFFETQPSPSQDSGPSFFDCSMRICLEV